MGNRPLYLSYKFERYVQSTVQASKSMGLDDLLRIPGGFESFRAFCNTGPRIQSDARLLTRYIAEFSAENILFFKR